jgi:hypothetical protein
MSEDMALWGGCGWVNADTGAVVAPDGSQVALGAESTRSMRSDDARERIADREQEAVRSARADLLESQARVGIVESPAVGEVFARFSQRCDLEDRRAARRAEEELNRVRFGEVDVVERPTVLRAERFTMERQARERAEAAAARQVEGAELDQLRQEVTQLRSLLHAHGIRPKAGW